MVASAQSILPLSTAKETLIELLNGSFHPIIGSDVSDILIGTTQSDIIVAGLGNDTLLGGEGNDTYVFRTGDGNDVIKEEDVYKRQVDWRQIEGRESPALPQPEPQPQPEPPFNPEGTGPDNYNLSLIHI